MIDTVWEDRHKFRWRVVDANLVYVVLKSVSGEARLRVKKKTLLKRYVRLC
jgi:hypothetical protein